MNNSIDVEIKSKKRIAREARIAKKLECLRTREERAIEIDKIYERLKANSINIKYIEPFQKIANEFIEYGIGASGQIPILELKQRFVYLLSNNRKHNCATMLQVIT